MSKSTIYEVAALAGVSIATVSRVTNQPQRVSEATRKRVTDAVNKLGYTPDYEAATRARHHNDRIAVIAPVNEYPSFILRLRGISSELADQDADLVIFQVDESKINNPANSKFIDFLASSGRYDGIIVLSLPIEKQDLTRIAQTRFPIVLVENNDTRFPRINLDNSNYAGVGVQYLIDKGYKDIGFIGYNFINSHSIDVSKEREMGYIKTMLSNEREVKPENIVIGEYDIGDTKEKVKELLSRKKRPDAIFCAADVIALGALKAAKELGLKVPQDIAIMGFDDIEMAEYLGLSTIRQNLEDCGRLAIRTLSKFIKEPDSFTPKEIFLPIELVIRETS